MSLSSNAVARINEIKNFPALLKFLRDDLGWPIESTDVEDLTFDYTPEELGFDKKMAVKIRSIKQLRPMVNGQPWGIFYIDFEPKRLPVGALRRLLRSLVVKKRGGGDGSQASWNLSDLLFISFHGEEDSRTVAFAHFQERASKQPQLRTFYWDQRETEFASVAESLGSLRWPSFAGSSVMAENWRKSWGAAFRAGHGEVIRDSRALSKKLAQVALKIRQHVADLIDSEDADKGPLHRLYSSFKRALLHDLSETRFADVLAQTFTYGLLAAKAEIGTKKLLEPGHLAEQIPATNPLLRELFEEFQHLTGVGLDKLDEDLGDLGVDELVDLLNSVDVDEALKNFGRTTMSGQEDPVVHFYEEFLKDYDKEQKVERGVFYTPKPVVSFIVRSVHEILQKEFGLEDGLASTATWDELVANHQGLKKPEGIRGDEPFVQILDPAVGTGTFLEACIQLIFDTLAAKWIRLGKNVKDEWNQYVPRHLLPRLHGFELMMAPYVVCHMKLGLRLKELGYDFQSGERLRVYLTNALEPGMETQSAITGLVAAVAHEANDAATDKRQKRFTVVIGNPPYSVHSQNQLSFTTELIRSRFYPNDARKENNPKSLQDDYVRFLLLGQLALESSGVGVLGFISNNSYISNLVFRRMRDSIQTFYSAISILDLHGSQHGTSQAQDKQKDENVFDIRQGVAIFIGRVNLASHFDSGIRVGDIIGPRETKYRTLDGQSALKLCDKEITPTAPAFKFCVESEDTEYLSWVSLENAFRVATTGMKTHRDDFAIAFDRETVEERLAEFSDPSKTNDQIRSTYRLSDTRDWKLEKARKIILQTSVPICVVPTDFRPFDKRYCAYDKHIVELPKLESNGPLMGGITFGIVFARQLAGVSEFTHIFACRNVVDNRIFYSNKGAAYVAPVVLAGNLGSELFLQSETSNLNQEFVAKLSPPDPLSHPFSPRAAIDWLYAILHSRVYRQRYFERLCEDFPRIPPPPSKLMAEAIGELGSELLKIHLEYNELIPRPRYFGTWNGPLTDWTFLPNEGQIRLSPNARFESVTEEMWEFSIGGYQPCQKWLKDRKGRTLTNDDVQHYEKMLSAIEQTIQIMGEIDEVIKSHGGWPGAFQGGVDG